MKWYVFCYTGYQLPEYGVISVRHLNYVVLDSERRYNGRERHLCTSVERVPGQSCHYGAFMSLEEIVPVQFYPRPLSLARFFGLHTFDETLLNPHLLELITCKTDKDPSKNRLFV